MSKLLTSQERSWNEGGRQGERYESTRRIHAFQWCICGLASTYIMGSLMYTTTKVNYVSHALSYVFAVFFFFFSDYM